MRSPGALHIALLVLQGFKVVASSILATAYCPKFREAQPPDVELCDEEESSAEVHSSTSALIVNASDSESDGDDDDDDDEIEEEAKKRSTVADWPSIMLRFKRLLPMMFPHPSFLSYGLIGRCLSLSSGDSVYGPWLKASLSSHLCYSLPHLGCGVHSRAASIWYNRE